jgi:hypothetical protein
MQIFEQKSFSFFKLYQIEKYLTRKEENEKTCLINPNELLVTPQIIISMNSRLIMKLVLAMDIKYNKPGDNVIIQNDHVLRDGKFDDSAYVYFVIDGVYRRLLLQFDKKHSINRKITENQQTSLIFDDIKNCYKLSEHDEGADPTQKGIEKNLLIG